MLMKNNLYLKVNFDINDFLIQITLEMTFERKSYIKTLLETSIKLPIRMITIKYFL